MPANNQTVADLLLRIYDIHERIIERTGGLEGLRDGAMLHATIALARAFTSDTISSFLAWRVIVMRTPHLFLATAG